MNDIDLRYHLLNGRHLQFILTEQLIDQFPECLTFFPLCSIDADCASMCLQLQSVCFKRFFHHGKIFFRGL